MTRATVAVFGALFVTAAAAGRADAQAQPPSTFGPRVGGAVSPPFSPYLNLSRGGGTGGLNYYGLVRPEIQARTAIQGLQQQTLANRSLINTLANPNDPANAGLPETGHAAVFMNTGGYFMNMSPAGNLKPTTAGRPPAGRAPPGRGR